MRISSAWLQQLFPLLINLFLHAVCLVKTNAILQSTVLVLIILIPNAIAKENTAKTHLYFSWEEKSPQITSSFFLGFGTYVKFAIGL